MSNSNYIEAIDLSDRNTKVNVIFIAIHVIYLILIFAFAGDAGLLQPVSYALGFTGFIIFIGLHIVANVLLGIWDAIEKQTASKETK